MSRTLMLSDYLCFNGASSRLSELLLMTAREWGQNYEWNAHQPLAVKGGLNPEVAKAIAEGRRPCRWQRTRRACPDPGTAPQSNDQRFHLRAGGVEVWRTSRQEAVSISATTQWSRCC